MNAEGRFVLWKNLNGKVTWRLRVTSALFLLVLAIKKHVKKQLRACKGGSSRPLDLPWKAKTVPFLWARSAINFRNPPRHSLSSCSPPKTLGSRFGIRFVFVKVLQCRGSDNTISKLTLQYISDRLLLWSFLFAPTSFLNSFQSVRTSPPYDFGERCLSFGLNHLSISQRLPSIPLSLSTTTLCAAICWWLLI